MTYNITAVGDATNIVQLWVGINTVSNGLFGIMLFLTVYIIVLFSVDRDYLPKTLVAVGFAMSIISGVMYVLELLPMWTVTINVVIFAFSIVYSVWSTG
jgi:hypothetical protein